jgi:hypothetical protein
MQQKSSTARQRDTLEGRTLRRSKANIGTVLNRLQSSTVHPLCMHPTQLRATPSRNTIDTPSTGSRLPVFTRLSIAGKPLPKIPENGNGDLPKVTNETGKLIVTGGLKTEDDIFLERERLRIDRSVCIGDWVSDVQEAERTEKDTQSQKNETCEDNSCTLPSLTSAEVDAKGNAHTNIEAVNTPPKSVEDTSLGNSAEVGHSETSQKDSASETYSIHTYNSEPACEDTEELRLEFLKKLDRLNASVDSNIGDVFTPRGLIPERERHSVMLDALEKLTELEKQLEEAAMLKTKAESLVSKLNDQLQAQIIDSDVLLGQTDSYKETEPNHEKANSKSNVPEMLVESLRSKQTLKYSDRKRAAPLLSPSEANHERLLRRVREEKSLGPDRWAKAVANKSAELLLPQLNWKK